jgi:hypothetical protein
MRGVGVLTGAAATAFTVVGSLGAASPAHASNYGFEINGTYRVISNGDWARTNEVYMNEKTVVETWQVTTTDCVSPWECHGAVSSDQGWSAPLKWSINHWLVDREIPNWQPCPDGTAATGYQKYYFYGRNEYGMDDGNPNLLGGDVVTKSPSGACGINKQLIIKLPLRVERVS